MSITAINSVEEFDAFTKAHEYVVVDFWADWCGPCKAIAPMFAKLAAANGVDGKLAFAKVDVEEQSEISERFKVTAMPTFLFLKNGEAVGAPVKVPGRGGALVEDGVLKMIRGADPRNLVAAVNELGKLVKPAEEEKKVEAAAEEKEEGAKAEL